jgi:hypothetical protein
MTTARTRSRPTPGHVRLVAADALERWGLPAAASTLAVVGAAGAAVGLLPEPSGLAIAIVGGLALAAERGLAKAATAATPGPATLVAIAAVWIAVCYAPFHALLFPGAPLHDPITLHGADATLPVTIPTAGHAAVDLTLEAQLPSNPAGGAAIPVAYTLVVGEGTQQQVLSGRFDETLRSRRLGRRGSTTVVQAHHAERRLLSNPGRDDLVVRSVSLEPAAGASLTVTALPHHLPSTPVLAGLAIAILAAVVAVDARLVPASDGTLTYVTPATFGAALVLWTSNTVHPTVSSLIGAIIFGGPLGLGLGALLWAIARRTLVDARR